MTATFGRFVENFSAFGAPRPLPTEADKAAAEAFVVRNYDNAEPPYCPVWLADRRAEFVERFARIIQQVRLVAEHREAGGEVLRKDMAA